MAKQPTKIHTSIEKFYSKELTYVLDYIINDLYEDYGFLEISPSIFVLGALEKEDSMLYKSVNTYLITDTITKIHDQLAEQIKDELGNIVQRSKEKPQLSTKLRYFISLAVTEARATNSELINTDHVLLSMLANGEKNITDLFRKQGLTYVILHDISNDLHDVINDVVKDEKESDVLDAEKRSGKTLSIAELIEKLPSNPLVEGGTIIIKSSDISDLPSDFSALNILGNGTPKNTTKTNSKNIPYCTNLNKLSKEGKFDKLVGRDREVNEIFRVLGRRKTNNVILVGEQGVGKTQIVNGVVDRIVNNDAPIMFQNKEVWKFNSAEIVAGTTLRGMFEERMVSMIKMLKDRKNAILFIDDIHTIFSDKTKGDYDAGGIISELFTDGDVQVIATTSFKGYKAFYDANQDIVKKMQKVTVDPLNEADTYDILVKNRKYYEDFHRVTYPDNVIKECVNLSKRYITEKTLPSSAIDILDELGSYKKMNNKTTEDIKVFNEQLNQIKEEIDAEAAKDNFDKVKELEGKVEEVKNKLALREGKLRSKSKIEVTIDDLYTTISEHTNIPVGKLKSADKKELKNIDKKLKEIIIGQDEAIDVVSRAMKRNKVGLLQTNKPMGSFLFVGQTGTGKTLLAKTLAREIFGDEKYLIRFDMSEYTDKTAVNKLIGASAGYIGYNEGGLLTEAVKKNKYAVLLIDEVEKSNEEVYNLFLQVLDEGFLTDNTGEKVDFKNTIIILTSNVGTKKAGQYKALGFEASDDGSRKRSIIEKELKDKFPPEFINRLDEIIYFNNLTEENLRGIIKLELDKLNARLSKIGHSIEYNDDLIDFILKDIENEKDYGARPIIRSIRDNIENVITDLIIDNEYDNHNFNITIENNNVEIK